MDKKIIFADLDGTLIDTLSGEVFPEGMWDFRINTSVLKAIKNVKPSVLFIVSNQGGVSYGFVDEDDLITKLEFISTAIGSYFGGTVKVYYTFCSANDKDNPNRKPNTGMLSQCLDMPEMSDLFPEGYGKEDMLMIGDASGKPGQFSDSDKKCAENFGIDYLDVNDFTVMCDGNSEFCVDISEKLNTYKEFIKYLSTKVVGKKTHIIYSLDDVENCKFVGYKKVSKEISETGKIILKFQVKKHGQEKTVEAEWNPAVNYGLYMTKVSGYDDCFEGYMLFPTHDESEYFCLYYAC